LASCSCEFDCLRIDGKGKPSLAESLSTCCRAVSQRWNLGPRSNSTLTPKGNSFSIQSF
jgi:hypothetical protein